MRPIALAFALAACANPSHKGDKHDARGPAEEEVALDGSVHITSPASGETVDTTFTVSFTAGDGVTDVSLLTDGEVAAELSHITGGSDVVLSVETGGRHEVTLIGYDAHGVQTASDIVSFMVFGPSDPWVVITSPADGDTVPNPVHFAVSADPAIDSVALYADDWLLGEVAPGAILTYEFTGTGFERQIEAVGLQDGVEVATDHIAITVDPGSTADISDFNAAVMDRIEAYPTDGSFEYYWPSGTDWGGNPNDIYYLGRLFSPGDEAHRSYCVGLTFEVFMFAFDEVDAATGGDGSLNGVTFDELYDLRTDWFVRDLYGMGVVDALENYGLGDRITNWEDIQPGDFLQFWRHSGSGHNNIFIDWETDGDGNIIGVTYWSTQSSTDGINYNTEYFGTSGSRIDPNSFFAGRARMPVDWEPWR